MALVFAASIKSAFRFSTSDICVKLEQSAVELCGLARAEAAWKYLRGLICYFTFYRFASKTISLDDMNCAVDFFAMMLSNCAKVFLSSL